MNKDLYEKGLKMGQPDRSYLERTLIMMYAIQNMELRSNHARSGTLRENKRRLCALGVVLIKKHVHSQSGNRLLYTCSCC